MDPEIAELLKNLHDPRNQKIIIEGLENATELYPFAIQTFLKLDDEYIATLLCGLALGPEHLRKAPENALAYIHLVAKIGFQIMLKERTRMKNNKAKPNQG